jgi:hypothetical protein
MNLTKLQTKSLNKFKDLSKEIKGNVEQTDDDPIALLFAIEKELVNLMSNYMIGPMCHKGHYQTGDK